MIPIQANTSILNGKLVATDQAVFSFANRAFRYGDGVFESMRVVNGKIPFFNYHLARLKRACDFLKLSNTNLFKDNYLADQIAVLLDKNAIQKGGRVRLTVYREDGGLYTPEQNKANYCIEASVLETNLFEINSKGLAVDLFPDIKKQIHALSNYKTNNCLTYVMAGIYKTEKKLDDCILLNDRNQVCEAISSNLFLVINGALYTPSLSEGCLDGVMRKIIIENAPKHRINIYEPAVMPNDILRADEVFLTNSIHGIQWVGSYKNKRFFNTTAKKIIQLVNELIE
jgi:branched-subunit amino acid aminotransferase/4-amino-4-deoxychorismate lyase